jgi:hypothetical protein
MITEKMRTGWEIDCFRENWNRAEKVLLETRLRSGWF